MAKSDDFKRRLRNFVCVGGCFYFLILKMVPATLARMTTVSVRRRWLFVVQTSSNRRRTWRGVSLLLLQLLLEEVEAGPAALGRS